jgi:uncharacterized protein YjbI with pentapeptide repeats
MKKLSFLVILMAITSMLLGQSAKDQSKSKKSDDWGTQNKPSKLFNKPTFVLTGSYYLKFAANSAKGLNVEGTDGNGIAINLRNFSGGNTQTFIIEPSTEQGYYYIKTKWGRAIDIAGYNNRANANLNTYDVHGGDNQKWQFFDAGNGDRFIVSKYGTYIETQNVNAASSRAWMADFNDNAPQRWKLEKIPLIQGTTVMTNFNSVTHGFKFANTFDNNGFVAGININFSGLCGGMSYAALDYYSRNTQIPQANEKPNEGTQITEYIRSRQWKTYENQADKWAELAATNWFGARTSEFWNWGVQGFNGGRLQELRSQLDNGNPAILGLFAAGDGGFGGHHQVIAIGYDMGRYNGDLGNYKDDLKIFVCDPNHPNEIMVLKPSTSKQRYYYEYTPEQIAKGLHQRPKEWLTYFVDMNYRTTTPLDPDVINRCSGVNFEGQNRSGQTHNQKMYRCAKAGGVNFRGATISGTDFCDSWFEGAIFYGANCTNTNFAYCNLTNANFQGADLRNTNFSSAKLKDALFLGADLKFSTMLEANAQYANFEGADLHRGKFCKTVFRNARLYRTSFNTTDCKEADFSGADLTGADFRNADISGANFTGAITKGIQLQGAIRTDKTIGL